MKNEHAQKNIVSEKKFRFYVSYLSQNLRGLRASQALAILDEVRSEILFSSRVGSDEFSLPTVSEGEVLALKSRLPPRV